MMQPSCPGLSLLTRAGFMVMTLRQSNNTPNGKVQTHQNKNKKGKIAEEQSQEHSHHFHRHQGDYSQRIPPERTVNSAYYCDILQQLNENARRLCPKLWQ
jgi:hypothetical protein